MTENEGLLDAVNPFTAQCGTRSTSGPAQELFLQHELVTQGVTPNVPSIQSIVL